jgi:TPR repeat protein
MFSKGEGVAQDHEKAMRYYRLAAAQEHVEAQYNLALYLSRRDYKESEQLFIRAANQGHAGAQFSLGTWYADGIGIAKDDAKAVHYLKLAVEQGYVTAQRELGSMYQRGVCVEKSDEEAERLYRFAAAQGDPDAQNFLGVMLLRKPHINQPLLDEAADLFRKAAKKYGEPADLNLFHMLYAGQCECCDEVEKEAMRAIREAENQGHKQDTLEFLWLNRHQPEQFKLPELK